MNDQSLQILPFDIGATPLDDGVYLLIAPDAQTSEYWYQNLKFISANDDKFAAAKMAEFSLHRFGEWETLPYDCYSPHPDIVSKRLQLLASLPSLRRAIIITCASAIKQRLCPQTHFDKFGIYLEVGAKLAQETMLTRLQQAGYQKTTLITEKGQYATRGNLLDLYPMGAPQPLRLEWFDETIESMRTFDIDTQLTITKCQKINILPRSELDFSAAGMVCFRQNARAQLGVQITKTAIYQQLAADKIAAGAEYYLPLFFDDSATFFDYLPASSRLLWRADLQCEISAASTRFDKQSAQRFQRLHDERRNPLLAPEQLWLTNAQLLQQLQTLALQNINKNCQLITFSGDEKQRRQQWQQLIANAGDKDCKLHFQSKGSLTQWQPQLEARAQLLLSPLQHSLQTATTLHLSESDLYLVALNVNYRQQANIDAQQIINSLRDLQLGAPVVHIDHGIGRYRGLQNFDDNEMMCIEYAKGNKLYVPSDELDLITRYAASNDDEAPLHELGGKQWQHSKNKIIDNIYDSASDLLAIYSAREAAVGCALNIDNEQLRAVAADFPYSETPDQQQAINAVLNDLSVAKPMDRIICGDVGFGKTEVALRAAYAVVVAGAQVALLAPTTLLANQHFLHFQERLQAYAVNVALLSRFKKRDEQTQLLQELARGNVDIIIGTHRLLQDDINFANLQLLIIDEEHRFGVRHKEKLKALRANVNLLTLSATPIPRTLNMALGKLRDLSLITTPPQGRQSVKTQLIQLDEDLIEEACQRERQRGGQIYFLHNDVKTIERIARWLLGIIPDLKIGIVHGQMHESKLERVSLDFYHRHYELLLATTIIESGIDIANANTIIINRADKLGLAQLHQLRGRVGRSHHQAYAYLITPSWSMLGKDAQRRLQAFTSLDSLGAGFLLASQDLEIRGAGELLGKEQSGQIQQIGISYYLELLARSVQALREGKKLTPEIYDSRRQHIECHQAAIFPDTYIYDPSQRLNLYQRLARASAHDGVEKIAAEIIDRFGEMPPPAKCLLLRTHLRLHARNCGVNHIVINAQCSLLSFDEQPNIDHQRLLALLQNEPQNYRMMKQNTLQIKHQNDKLEQQLQELEQFLLQIAAQ